MKYSAFLSHGRGADSELAAAIQTGLHQFAKPWYRLRAVRVFRDAASLASSTGLWHSIAAALDDSEFFVLLASPAAAASRWVDDEVAYWLAHRGPRNLLIAVTAGNIAWDDVAGDFDRTVTTCLPPSIYGSMVEQPRWTDLRHIDPRADLSLREPDFQDVVADLAAPLHGIAKDDLVGVDHRLRRAAVRLARAVVAGFLVLVVLAGVSAAVAIRQHGIAAEQSQSAAVRTLLGLSAAAASSGHLQEAARYGMAASSIRDDPETRGSLMRTVAGSRILSHARSEGEQLVAAVAFSPDSRTMITSGVPKATIWDVSDRTRPTVVSVLSDVAKETIISAAFFPDGRTLVAIRRDGPAQLWDLADRAHPTLLTDLAADDDRRDATVAALVGDGQTLAIGSDRQLTLWNVADRERPVRLGESFPPEGSGTLTSIAFSPDGRTLAAGGEQGTILWDVSDLIHPVPLGKPLGDTGQIVSVAMSPDGVAMATARDDGAVSIWDITDRASPFVVDRMLEPDEGQAASVAFSSEGRTLASARLNGTVVLWDLSRLRQRDPATYRDFIDFPRIDPPMAGHAGPVLSVTFAPDGHTVASGGLDSSAILWDLDRRTRPNALAYLDLTGESGLRVLFSPDGRTLARSVDGAVRLLDFTDRTDIAPMGEPIRGGTGSLKPFMEFSPDGRTFVAAFGDSLVLWDLTDRRHPAQMGQPLTGDGSPFGYLVFSPDGRTLAAMFDASVLLWDLSDRAWPARRGPPLPFHVGAIERMGFIGNGRTLAVTGEEGYTQWDLSDANHPVAITNAGRPAPSAFGDLGPLSYHLDAGNLTLWDITGSAPVQRGDPLTAPVGTSWTTVMLSRDGRLLIASSTDNIQTFRPDNPVNVWDLTDPARPTFIATLTVHRGLVRDMTLSADGHFLVTGSDDGYAAVWDLTSVYDLRAHLVEWGCQLAERGLTPQEWAAAVPDEPFQETCPGTA